MLLMTLTGALTSLPFVRRDGDHFHLWEFEPVGDDLTDELMGDWYAELASELGQYPGGFDITAAILLTVVSCAQQRGLGWTEKASSSALLVPLLMGR
jgi:hypothetical protein